MATTTFAVGTASTSNTSTYASGAFTPAANDLLVVFVICTGHATGAGSLSNSLGITFHLVGTALKAASADQAYCFVGNWGAAASSQTVTFATNGSNATGCSICVFRVAGLNGYGSDAIRQYAKQDNQASGGTPAPAFSANALTGNATLGHVANATNPATMTPPTSWTESAGADIGYNTPTTGQEVVFRDSGFTGTTITWGGTSASAFCSQIVEIDNSVVHGTQEFVGGGHYGVWG